MVNLTATMLRCFKPQAGVDGQVFATAIVGILLRYPMSVVREVTCPFTGLPTKTQFMPTPFDVRQACEELMRPIRDHQYHRQNVERQLAERDDRICAPPRTPDPAPDPITGKHPPGTILSNYDEAVRIYGRPIGRGEPTHSKFPSGPVQEPPAQK